jgi:CubicO group peptidase (beta-lactamase class C family)
MSTLASTGEAWDQLEEKVDSLVKALIEETNLPGITVAVTKEGRLLLSKGYGYALVDGTRKLPMKPCSRSKIGSVTKAVVTGPSGFQLMKSKNIDPKSQKLYGPKGFFGGNFDADIDIGIKAFPAESAQWKEWYEKITIQHLLDHKAGFTRSGPAAKDVAKMFGVSEDEVTLEQEHRYFLRTRRLCYEPGNPPADLKDSPCYANVDNPSTYSNYGFGLWALLIKEMSGKPYANYVRGNYLRPFKLHNAVRWQRANPDSCDAYGHKLNNNQQPEPYPFEESALGTGLAAGGFTASAESLVRLTASLDKKYTTEELDSMGWFERENAKGHLRLSHNGSIPGGLAYVVMFSEGYRSSTEDLDISEVHIAVATNVRDETDAELTTNDLETLGNNIALAVPVSNVPATFDLWKQGKSVCSCEYVRRAVPANDYQEIFDDSDRSGYRLEWINGYTDHGKVHFNVIFRTNEPEMDWVSHHEMTGTIYQQKFDEYRNAGFSLDHVDSYVVGNKVFYAAIWAKSGSASTAYHGKTAEEHQESFDSLTGAGWKPKVISVASVDGKLRYTALYTKQPIGNFEARSFLTAGEYQTKFDQNKARGWHLHYLNSYLHKGKLHFSAIWAEKPELTGTKARHGLTAAGEFVTLWEDALSTGFSTRAITGCEEGGKVQYAVYWTK